MAANPLFLFEVSVIKSSNTGERLFFVIPVLCNISERTSAVNGPLNIISAFEFTAA